MSDQSGKLVAIRLNAEELIRVRSKADAINARSIGAYIKAVAMDDGVPVRRSKVVTIDPEVSRQIAWIGNNLNQLSRSLNFARKNNMESIDYISALSFITAIHSDIAGIKTLIAERLK